MAVKTTASGKMDKRTKEYKEPQGASGQSPRHQGKIGKEDHPVDP